ncbi:MAG: O-acetyl-ADP-ribose deacetylase [Oligoflexus sp.]
MLGIRRYRSVAIDLFQGDITSFVCDAMVNAANESLAGGGGVDGAIHRAGGPTILEECRQIGRCPTGQAVKTNAGQLPAKILIHAVGPRWRGGEEGEADLLASAYQTSLQLAIESACEHIAFPSISTGVYGFPIDQAAGLAMDAIKDFLDQQNSFRRITFVQFSLDDYKVYQQALFHSFPEMSE